MADHRKKMQEVEEELAEIDDIMEGLMDDLEEEPEEELL